MVCLPLGIVLDARQMTTDIERALNEKQIPWTDIEYRTKEYWVFSENNSNAPRHLLFVPTSKQISNLWECYRGAYKFGYEGVESNKWGGFTVEQKCGKAAGQIIAYPYVRMMPAMIEDDVNG